MKTQFRDAVIRTAPMPSDCNSNGDIFGGWALAQMDIAVAGACGDRRGGGDDFPSADQSR